MSAPAPTIAPWVPETRVHPTFQGIGGARATISERHTSTNCPVCRRSHGTRLVRPIVVETPRANAWRAAEDFEAASRYFPPTVPVLASRSGGPTARSARWSVPLP